MLLTFFVSEIYVTNILIMHVSSLIHRHLVETGSDAKVFDLLAGAVLRFYKDFCRFIQNDPKCRYSSGSLHPFQYRVQQAFRLAGVHEDEINAWCTEIEEDFYGKNIHALPINEGSVNYRRVFIDGRTMLETMQQIAIHQQQTSQLVHNLNNSISLLHHIVNRQMEMIRALTNSTGAHEMVRFLYLYFTYMFVSY